MSLVSIKTAIKNKLDCISHLENVYSEDTGSEAGNPYATVTKARFESSFADTNRNFQEWFFTIRLYTKKTDDGFTIRTAERVSDELVDEIVTAFHMDTTLSGSCKYVEPIDGDFSWVSATEAIRLAEITLKATEVINISTGATA